MNHVRNPKRSLPEPLTWAADESVRTLPCHRLPAQNQSGVRRFRAWFERYGLVTVFVPALLPIPMPLKLFVVSAGALQTGIRPFLLVVVLARVLRFFSEAWLGVKLGIARVAAAAAIVETPIKRFR